MKRELAKDLAVYSQLDFSTDIPEPIPTPYEEDDSQLKFVLDEIFSVDPVTGFPKGDISYFLSPSGNPQVKQWLEQNLLKPRAKDTGSSLQEVSDDLVAEMSRQRGEDYVSYAKRLQGIYDDARKELDNLKSE